jgi:hypothetical protein
VKRWFYTPLIFLYVLFSLGIQVHLHYCCGNLKDVTFFSPVQSCCDHEQGENNVIDHACCQFDQIALKFESDHFSSSFSSLVSSEVKSLGFDWKLEWCSSEEHDIPVFYQEDTGPSLPRYICHHALIYYA